MDGILGRGGAAKIAHGGVETFRIEPGLVQLLHQVEVMHVHLGPLLLLFLLEEVVDAVGGNRRLADRRGQQMRANDVTGHEVAFLARHLVELVGVDQVAVVRHLFEPFHVAALADGRDDQVRLQHALVTLVPLFRDRLHSIHGAVTDPQARRPTVFTDDHLEGHDAVENGDALGGGVDHFVLGCHHLVLGEQGGQGHIRSLRRRRHRRIVGDVAVVHNQFRTVRRVLGLDVAETARHRDDVDGGVTAADADHLLRRDLHATLVERLEESDTADAVRRSLPTWDGQSATAPAAKRPEHRVELFLDVRDRDLAPDAGLHTRLNAHLDDAVDLVIQLVPGNPVAGDAVAHHAAELFILVEDGHGVTLAAQLVCRRHAGGAAANDCNPLACVGAGLEPVAGGDGRITDVLFDGVDADGVLDIVPVAPILARGRADAPHHRGERIRVGGTAEHVLVAFHARRRLLLATSDRQPAANVLTRGAAALARRGLVNISGALVRRILDENLFAPVIPCMVTVLETTEIQRGFHLLSRSRHSLSLLDLNIIFIDPPAGLRQPSDGYR